MRSETKLTYQSKIAFLSYRDNDFGEIYVMNADGTEQRNLSNSKDDDLYLSWSPSLKTKE